MTLCLSAWWIIDYSTRTLHNYFHKKIGMHFSCSTTRLVGALIRRIVMIPKVVFMLITWETLEDHQCYSSITLRTVTSHCSKILVGISALVVWNAKSVTQWLKDSIILKSTSEFSVINNAAINQKFALSTMELRSVILLLNLANNSERILLLIRRFRPLMTYTNSWHVSTLMRRKRSFNRWSRFKTMKLKLRKELEQFWTHLPTPQQTRAHLQNSLFKAHFLNLFHRLITTNLEWTSLNQSLLSSRRVLKPMILKKVVLQIKS